VKASLLIDRFYCETHFETVSFSARKECDI